MTKACDLDLSRFSYGILGKSSLSFGGHPLKVKGMSGTHPSLGRGKQRIVRLVEDEDRDQPPSQWGRLCKCSLGIRALREHDTGRLSIACVRPERTPRRGTQEDSKSMQMVQSPGRTPRPCSLVIRSTTTYRSNSCSPLRMKKGIESHSFLNWNRYMSGDEPSEPRWSQD